MAQGKDNVVRFRRPKTVNIGVIICIIIFIYVMFHLYTFLTTEQITVYEVAQGTIVANDTYQAVAIRDEEIIYSDRSGYLYYYGKNRSRVGVRSLVYGVDTTGALADIMGNAGSEQVSFSPEQLKGLLGDINSYCNDYDPSDFQRIYTFKNNLADSLELIYSQQLAEEYRDAMSQAAASNTLINYNAPYSGVLMFGLDGYEGLTVNDITPELFETIGSGYQNLRAQGQVEANTPVYKMIRSDDWQLVIRLDEAAKARIGDSTAIEILFTEDEASTWATCEQVNIAGEDYLVLSLDDSVERYADCKYRA